MELGRDCKNYCLRPPPMSCTAVDCDVREIELGRVSKNYWLRVRSNHEVYNNRLLGSITRARLIL